MVEEVSRRVVDQRVRNRVIEYLELAASFEAQIEYDAARVVNVPNEVINQWQDWVPVSPRLDPRVLEVYTAEELESLIQFQEAWELATNGEGYPDLAEVQRLPSWIALRGAAETALAVFGRRGRLSEDREDG